MPAEILKLYVGDMPDHACEPRDIETVLDDLDAAFRSLGDYAAGLSEEELRRPATSVGRIGFGPTLGVIRHVLHDAEHHLLDIRRGIALPLVATNPLPV